MNIKMQDYNLLSYFHDAVLLNTLFYINNGDGYRYLKMTIRCNRDCEYEDFSGKTVDLLFIDTLIVKGTLLGHMVGNEYVNFMEPKLSPEVEEFIAEMVKSGVAAPREKMTVVLHSGSEISIACDRIEITVLDQNRVN